MAKKNYNPFERISLICFYTDFKKGNRTPCIFFRDILDRCFNENHKHEGGY